MERYYVKRPTGKVFGPFDENAIRLMLRGKKLGADAQVSTDNENWLPISEVATFGDALGVADNLPASAGNLNLPRSSGAPDLPISKGSGLDLPKPKVSGLDLPKPKVSGLDLPKAKSTGLDLPRAKSSGPTDLPVAKGVDLQSTGSDLPRSAGSDLPRSAGSVLPQSAGSSLPQSAGSVLPQSAGGSLPRSSENNLSVAGPSEEEDLFGAPIESDDDLFSPPPDDDLFAIPAGMDEDSDDLFAAPVGMDEDSDDLFAAPAGMDEDSDDLFAAPAGMDEPSDDLFAAPAGPSDPFTDHKADPLDEEDLFEAGPMDDDDLFAAAPADDDDFLGGDQGFSFLDDEPSASSDDGLEDWESSLTGNEVQGTASIQDEWGDDLVADKPRPSPSPASGASRPAAAHGQPPSQGMGFDPFRPASTGIPETPEAQQPAGQSTVESDKKRGLMTLIGVPVLGLVLLGAVGFGVYSAFFTADLVEEEVVLRGPSHVELDMQTIGADNYAGLLSIIERASSGDLDTTNRGRLLLAKNLFLARYEDGPLSEKASLLAANLAAHDDNPTVSIALAFSEARSLELAMAYTYAEPLRNDPELAYFANLAMGLADTLAYFDGQKGEPLPEPPPLEPELDEEGNPIEVEEEPGPTEEELRAAAEEEEERQRTYFRDRAKEALARAIASDNPGASPHYWLSRLAFHDREVDEGLEHLERAVNSDPDHVASRLLAAQTYYNRGNLNDATDHLQKIIDELGAHASEKERASAFHIMGMVYQARQNSEGAINMFTRALNTDSSRVDSLRALAHQYEQAERYEEALNFFTTDQNLGQEDPEVMLGIARSHRGLEQYTSAIRILEQGEQQFPEDARFPYVLGQLNQRRGTLFEARQSFERAVEIDPDLLTAHAALALLTLQIDNDPIQGDQHVRAIVERDTLIEAAHAATVAEFYRLSYRPELARQWNEAALRIDPNYWSARLALSRLLLDENRTTEALTLLERARAEGIQDIRLSAYLADAYRQDRQFDRAIEEINSVISQESDNKDYIFIRGRIYFDQGNFATAREDFNNAYQLDPRFHLSYFYVGRTFLAERDYTTATRIFRHVLDYQPDSGMFHYYMGRTFEADGSEMQALDSYRRATAVDPRWANEHPEIFVRRGRLLSRIGYTNQGKRDLMRAMELRPDMREAQLAMGETFFQEQDYAAAIQHYRTALGTNPEDPRGQFELGMSYLYLRQQQNAARHLQLAIQYGYNRPSVYRTLGRLYDELGQRRQAIEAFQTFLRLDDDSITDADRREILRAIEDLGG